MTTELTVVGSCQIDSADYTMVRTDKARGWQKTLIPEPPYDQGAPAMLSEPQVTWHLGGFKSRQGIPGTSEYGLNTDSRFPFRLQNSPVLEDVATLTNGETPIKFAEMNGFLWVLGGRYLYYIDPSDNSIHQVKDFGASVLGVDMLVWGNPEPGVSPALYITTNHATSSLWRITVTDIVGPTILIENGGSTVVPYRIATNQSSMFRISKNAVVRHVAFGLDPLVETNWADSIILGSDNIDDAANALVEVQGTVIAIKPDGAYAIDTNGIGAPIIRRMGKNINNGKGSWTYEPYVFIPTGRSVLQYVPGRVDNIGLEVETLNESPAKGVFTSFCSDGKFIYALLHNVDLSDDGFANLLNNAVSNACFICVGREALGNEPGFGPYVWDTWVYLGDHANGAEAITFSNLWDAPCLIVGVGGTVKQVFLDAQSSAGINFSNSGWRLTPILDFGDNNIKDFPKIEADGWGLDATHYWSIYYCLDDNGTWHATDINANFMKVADNTLHTFFLPASAKARIIQYAFAFFGAGNTYAELRNFIPYAVPTSSKIPIITVQLQLTEGIKRERGWEQLTADQQLAALKTLSETAGSVVSSGPWGDILCNVRDVQIVEMIQEGATKPEYLVTVQLQEREVA